MSENSRSISGPYPTCGRCVTNNAMVPIITSSGDVSWKCTKCASHVTYDSKPVQQAGAQH